MKKLLIGILIIIPIIIILVLTLATNILIANAHIPVEKLTFKDLQTNENVYSLSFQLSDIADSGICLKDYLYVDVLPKHANGYTIEWRISGDPLYTDEKYEAEYNEYKSARAALRLVVEEEVGSLNISDEHKDAYDIAVGKYLDSSQIVDEMLDILLGVKYPAVYCVDDNGNEVSINTTGKLQASSYCNFTVEAVAENVSRTLSVSIVGYDVEQVVLHPVVGDSNTLNVGESMRLAPSYTPIDSIVNHTIWTSSDDSVASVDNNGVVTAKSQGETTITLNASVHSSETRRALAYVAGTYVVRVEANGASSIYGSKLVTSKTSLTLEEIGVDSTQIESISGGEIALDTLTITSQSALITLKSGKQLAIERCLADDITIQNMAFYSKESGYVLSVGENELNLAAEWADMLKSDVLTGVRWTSSDTSVAIVDEDGNVVGLSDGYVTITASKGDSVCELEIDVRKKISSIQLRTSNASLAIGLARETVYASQRYATSDLSDNTKIDNYAYIVVQGQPDTDELSEILEFYSAFTFEIVEGKDYAYFDDIDPHKLVFKQTLEGKGKQNIVVRVKAKYPKYENSTRFTTEDVTITAVYGVEANDIADARRATQDQYAYATAEGNSCERDRIFENVAPNGKVFIVEVGYHSHNLYSMVLASSFGYEYDEDNPDDYIINDNTALFVYGDVYGNNNIISARKQQVQSGRLLINFSWSGITVSNCIFRANDLGENGTISDASDTSGFTGNVCEIWSRTDDVHLENITFEYSIFENAQTGMSIFGADVSINGCIFRNLIKAGLYAPARMNGNNDIFYPCYTHLNLHNMICSNTLGSFMSVAYETYTVEKSDKGRFVTDDLAQNESYFLEHFYNAGINIQVKQTGFLEAYNWQNLKDAALIQTGDSSVDSLIGGVAGDLIDSIAYFDTYKWVSANNNNEKYIHLGFLVSGVQMSTGVMDAPNYLDLDMADDSFHEIELAKVVDPNNVQSSNPLAPMASRLLSAMTIKMYCYDNTNKITPYSTYYVDAALVERMHG